MEMSRSTRMTLEADESESNRIIDEALVVAFMATRLLRAWHRGEADAQESMQILWEGFCQIQSVSGVGFRCDGMRAGGHDDAGIVRC